MGNENGCREKEGRCVLKKIVRPDKVELLRRLFDAVGMEGPKNDQVGEIDLDKTKVMKDCTFMYSWGFSYYCDNPECIDKFLNSDKKSSSSSIS